jgi:hypothetical protein
VGTKKPIGGWEEWWRWESDRRVGKRIDRLERWCQKDNRLVKNFALFDGNR